MLGTVIVVAIPAYASVYVPAASGSVWHSASSPRQTAAHPLSGECFSLHEPFAVTYSVESLRVIRHDVARFVEHA